MGRSCKLDRAKICPDNVGEILLFSDYTIPVHFRPNGYLAARLRSAFSSKMCCPRYILLGTTIGKDMPDQSKRGDFKFDMCNAYFDRNAYVTGQGLSQLNCHFSVKVSKYWGLPFAQTISITKFSRQRINDFVGTL